MPSASLFSGGVQGTLSNIASGTQRTVKEPNLFGPGTVGGLWGKYLRDLLTGETSDTAVFKSLSTSLRDTLAREAATAKTDIATAANAGGYFDSGARLAGFQNIDRARLGAFSQGLSDILARLEERKMQAAFPFLQARIGAFGAWQNALQGAEGAWNANYAQNSETARQIISSTGQVLSR